MTASMIPASGPIGRRAILAGGGCLLLAGTATAGTATAATATAATPAADTRLVEDAAVWGTPLVRTGRYRAATRALGLEDNHFYLDQTLATPSLKLAAPNVDTIYGFAWIELSAGPIAVQVPDGGDRYYSIQFIDAYETILGYAGNSATSHGPGLYVVTGPGWAGTLPAGANRVDSPTSLVLALTRTLVKSDADLPAAQAQQASYAIGPLSAVPGGLHRGTVREDALSIFPKPDLRHDAVGYFRELDDLVRHFPPRGQEATAFRRLAPLHLGDGFATHNKLPPEQLQQALDGALAKAQQRGRQISTNDHGWKVNYDIRAFNADPLTRAALNSVGPGAHIAKEAVYFVADQDESGVKFDGSNDYDIVFPKDRLPPTKSFWSLIIYDAESLLLVPNRLNRYTINDRTPDLVHGPRGDLPILISSREPTKRTNWLPAPAAPFVLVLRIYEPDPSLLAGHYKVPAVVRKT